MSITTAINPDLHDWPDDVASAREVQNALRARVIREDALGAVNYVAGVDVGFEEQGRITRAAVALSLIHI
mgnify:FL=1